MPRHELWELRSMQAAPLTTKIALTKQRINEWVDEFGEDGVYVSFSGGKDSTVLLDIVREEYPDMPAVFVNTGLEYPSVRAFALSQEYVEEVTPTMSFLEIIHGKHTGRMRPTGCWKEENDSRRRTQKQSYRRGTEKADVTLERS